MALDEIWVRFGGNEVMVKRASFEEVADLAQAGATFTIDGREAGARLGCLVKLRSDEFDRLVGLITGGSPHGVSMGVKP